jgi:class 3 adenylate cyclase
MSDTDAGATLTVEYAGSRHRSPSRCLDGRAQNTGVMGEPLPERVDDRAPVDAAAEALDRHAWREAYDLLSAADARGALQPAELEMLAQSAWWTGHLPQAIEVRERAYGASMRSGDVATGVMAAISLARDNLFRNDVAVAGGWLSRAAHLLEGQPEGVGHGYLEALRSFRAALTGDNEEALRAATRAFEIAERLGDPDLAAYARAEKGFALVVEGRVDEGLALIDEATIAAVGGELQPSTAGGVCCTTIEACAALGDWARAASWTEAQDRWCRREGINGYPGMCRLFRSEIKQLRGAWMEAEAEARQASVELDGFMPAATGDAFYRIAELRLLRGDLLSTEEALVRAHALGRDPEPLMSMLRLAQGRTDLAVAGIRRVLDEQSTLPSWRAPPGTPLHRQPRLRAQVEIALAAGDPAAARSAADELHEISEQYGGQFAADAAASASGAVLLAEGDATAAGQALRSAVAGWNELKAPYEAARARVLLAEAHLAEGRPEQAVMELHAARMTFEQLGAVPDVRRTDERLAALEAPGASRPSGTETERVERTFVFTDIVDSTRLAEAMGDEAWSRIVRWHDQVVGAIVAEHGGEEIKATGDGFFLAFADPGAAIDAMVAIQRRLAESGEQHGFAPTIRIGLHTAEANRAGLDYIGIGVNYAARIGAAAASGEILASDSTVAGANRSIRDLGRRTLHLRGISEPVPVTSIGWA